MSDLTAPWVVLLAYALAALVVFFIAEVVITAFDLEDPDDDGGEHIGAAAVGGLWPLALAALVIGGAVYITYRLARWTGSGVKDLVRAWRTDR